MLLAVLPIKCIRMRDYALLKDKTTEYTVEQTVKIVLKQGWTDNRYNRYRYIGIFQKIGIGIGMIFMNENRYPYR